MQNVSRRICALLPAVSYIMIVFFFCITFANFIHQNVYNYGINGMKQNVQNNMFF